MDEVRWQAPGTRIAQVKNHHIDTIILNDFIYYYRLQNHHFNYIRRTPPRYFIFQVLLAL